MKTIICAILLILIASVVLGTGTGPTVSVTTSSLATTEDSVEVSYSVVGLVVPRPAENAELSDAYLEFYMDVSSTLPDSLSGVSSTLEITPMPSLVEGKLGSVPSDVIVKKSVRIGDNQTVRIHITGLLREAFAQVGEEDSAELTLLVGPISGSRYGRFTANAVPGAAGGAKATLTVLTRERYDPDGAQ